MANSRELSQFGRLVEIKDGTHIGIGTQSDVAIGFGTITAIQVGDSNTVYYGDGSNLSGVSASGGAGAASTAHINAESLRVSGISTFNSAVIGRSFGSSLLITPSSSLTPSWIAVSSGSDPSSVPSGLTSVSSNAVLSQGTSEQIFLDLGSSVTTVTFDFDTVLDTNFYYPGWKVSNDGSTWTNKGALNTNGSGVITITDSSAFRYVTLRSLTNYNGGTIATVESTTTSAAAPQPDSDTKINFPAEDVVTVEPGGVEKLRVDSDGVDVTGTINGHAIPSGSGTFALTSDLPSVPTNNNQLTNGAGYITGYTVTESDVTTHQAALSITESQISDLGTYLTSSDLSSYATTSDLSSYATTSDLSSYATTSYVDTEVAGIVDSAPGTLNTLNELAAALGDDANFSTTVTNSIAAKMPLAGGTFTGNVDFNDDVKARFGTGDDLQIYHDGTVNRVRFDVNTVFEKNDSTDIATFLPDGAVTLFHNGSSKFATKSDGIDVTGEVQCDTLDVDGLANIQGSLTVQSDLLMGDSDKIKLGNNDDLQIYHDGSNSYIDDAGTGNLKLNGNEVHILSNDNSEYSGRFISNGAVELYHNGNKKLETTSSGVTVSGDANVTGNVNSSSDASLKENIVPIDDALNKVLAMTGVEYDRIDMDGVHQIGVIAQEIEKVIPELVTENETTGLKSVSYGNITAVLIEAIKQQQEQINILRNKLNEL